MSDSLYSLLRTVIGIPIGTQLINLGFAVIRYIGGPVSADDYARAVALLEFRGPAEAARLLNSDIDTQNFLESNRLQLDASELEELKARFRA